MYSSYILGTDMILSYIMLRCIKFTLFLLYIDMIELNCKTEIKLLTSYTHNQIHERIIQRSIHKRKIQQPLCIKVILGQNITCSWTGILVEVFVKS